jgi:hypothetical protein
MNIIERVRRDLLTGDSFDTNILYEFSSEEQERINAVKSLLDCEYDYLDIVLDKKVFRDIAMGIDLLPYDQRITEIRMNLIEHIVKELGIRERLVIELEDLAPVIQEKAFNLGKKGFRIHVFIDEVESVSTQQVINDMYSTDVLHVRGYTTKCPITNKTTNIDKKPYFIRIDSQAKVLEIKRNYKIGIEERNEEND